MIKLDTATSKHKDKTKIWYIILVQWHDFQNKLFLIKLNEVDNTVNNAFVSFLVVSPKN